MARILRNEPTKSLCVNKTAVPPATRSSTDVSGPKPSPRSFGPPSPRAFVQCAAELGVYSFAIGGVVSCLRRLNMLGDSQVQEFKVALRGQLIAPTDTEYDATRKVFNAMIDRRPALIVRCAGAADV